LRQVERAVGDFAVYYEPRRSSGDMSSRGGRQAYFAVATITAVEPDPALAEHFYARIGDYLEFDRPVPFREGGHYYESFLRRDDGKTSKGAFGRAVRLLPDDEFDAILWAGFGQNNAERLALIPGTDGFEEPQADFERPVIERLTARPFRDQAFTRQIRLAYDNRCAVTGLRLINGGGRPEVQAAHIRPVARAGPDSPRNGLALCATAHWMFDRGLISIDDDLRILSARQGLPEDATRLFRPSGQLRVPDDPVIKPHPGSCAGTAKTSLKDSAGINGRSRKRTYDTPNTVGPRNGAYKAARRPFVA
jgi:putative restriction endonuclease